MDPIAVSKLTLSQRLARIYGYDKASHFKTTDCDTRLVEKFALATRDLCKQDVLPATENMKVVIDFLKTRFEQNQIYSMPCLLFNAAMNAVNADTLPGDISCFEIAVALAPWGEEFALQLSEEDRHPVFFTVVDARPESKYQVRVGHVAVNRNQLKVKRFSRYVEAQNRAPVLSFSDAVACDLDARAWSSAVAWNTLMRYTRQWQCVAGEVSVELVPSTVMQALCTHIPLRPSNDILLDDDDDLFAILEEARKPGGALSPGAIVPYDAPIGRTMVATSRALHLNIAALDVARLFLDRRSFLSNGTYCQI
jgi:hypothetical protein